MKIPLFNDFGRSFNDPVWLAVAETICQKNNIPFTHLKRAERGENIVFLADDAYVVKIYTPLKNGFHREKAALEFVEGRTSLPVAEIVHADEIEGYYYLITTQLNGRQVSRDEWLGLGTGTQIALLSDLADGLRKLHSEGASEIDFDWDEFIKIRAAFAVEGQTREGGNPEWLESLPGYLEKYLCLLPHDFSPVFMHGDVHFGNLLVANTDGRLKITGLFDFADSLKGFYEYEFVAIGVLMIQGQGELQRELFRMYGYQENEMDEDLRRRLMLLTILYEHSSLRRYAERLGPHAINLTLDELERAIWSFV